MVGSYAPAVLWTISAEICSLVFPSVEIPSLLAATIRSSWGSDVSVMGVEKLDEPAGRPD